MNHALVDCRVMSRDDKISYFDGLNQQLVAAIPDSATTIVDVGCANGCLGAALKADRPERRVIGIEREPAAVEIARTRLDCVLQVDLEIEIPSVEAGSVDCVVFGDVLEHLVDPIPLLRAARTWLDPKGVIVCSIPNLAHNSVLEQILRGDFQYQGAGVLDRTHLRFYTYATIIKLLLEGGFSPTISDVIDLPNDAVVAAAEPLLELFRVSRSQAMRHLNAYQYIVTGKPLRSVDDSQGGAVPALTFVACVNDESQLANNLLASPFLGADSPHEVLLYRGMGSAAEGLNRGINEAKNDLIVLLHQDVYLPSWWPAQLVAQWTLAATDGPVALAGAIGVRYRLGGRTHVGHVVDRDNLLEMSTELPADVDGLDEMLMVVPKDTSLRFQPAMGWHLYGSDLALQAHQHGLRTVVLDLPCYHNSLLSGLDASFRYSESVLARRWPMELPIVTNSSTIAMDPLGTDLIELREEVDRQAEEIRVLGAEMQRAHTQTQVEHDQLVAEQGRLGHLRQQLAKREQRIAAMESSTTWRAGRILNRFKSKLLR